MTPAELADIVELRTQAAEEFPLGHNEAIEVVAMLRRLSEAEADADRLASQLERVPPKHRFSTDERALRLHREAVSRRATP